LQAALVLMSRAPIPGETKTRLGSHLKDKECADLHQAFLKDMNSKLLNLQKVNPGVDLYLSFTPADSSSLFAEIIDDKFNRIPQRGKGLGAKMYNAFFDAYQKSNLPVLITGSDLPLLNIEILTEALAGLKERDLVIGPSSDGGYYLIGMKKPEKFIFDFKKWGNNSVLERTVREARKYDLKCHFLPEVNDIDTFKELLQLRSEIIKAKKDFNYLKNTKIIIEEIFKY